MTREQKRRLSFFFRVSWALLLFMAWGLMALKAIPPLARTWRLGNTSQAGELIIYNAKRHGGYYGLPVEIGDYDADGKLDLVLGPMGANAGPVSAPESQRYEAGEVYVYPGSYFENRGGGPIEGILDRDVFEDSPPGLTIWGARPGDMLGTELFTFDLNGDGIQDLLASAQNYDGVEDACARENCGGVFVVFGRPGLLDGSQVLDLARLGTAEPLEGVLTVIGPHAASRLGIWVEAGDLDGDGFGDLLMGADQASPDSENLDLFHKGMVTVIYGRPQFPAVIDLATELAADGEEDGLPGVSFIFGEDKEDHFGSSIHSRDLDRDGRDELIVSAALNRLSASQPGLDCRGQPTPGNPCGPPPTPLCSHYEGGGDGPANDRPNAGEVRVFFSPLGGERLPRRLDLSEPLPALLEGRMTVIHGRGSYDLAGEELTSGDFNGDSYPDLALGALTARSPLDVSNAGMTHVIYWRPGLEGMTIDLEPTGAGGSPEGVTVSTMFGLHQLDILGDTLSAGDFDHDGFDDLAIGMPHVMDGTQRQVGMVAVVLGRAEPWPRIWAPQADELPTGLDVAYILGADAYDLMSYSMEARDYDGDGYTDLFPNAMHGNGFNNQFDRAGEAYLVSGYHLVAATLGVRRVDPTRGSAFEQTIVELLGSGFTTSTDTRVFIGGTEVGPVEVVNGSVLRVTVPPPPGMVLEPLDLRVETRYGSVVLPHSFSFVFPEAFIRGDTNLDLSLNVTDPIVTLQALFLSQGTLRCRDAADANDSGVLDVADAIYTLNYLFLNGKPPPEPFPGLGVDPTPDNIGCQ